MVQKPSVRRGNFLLFVAPAFVLYALFFLLPFGQGLRISFTNWDGLTPKTPISMPRAEFESLILDRIQKGGDRDFVLSVYSLDAAGENYSRLSISGTARYRLERILAKAGYTPANYRDVGFMNYVSIFTGKIDERFYPRTYTQVNFNPNSSLPQEIDRKTYEKDFLAKLGPEEKKLASEFYALSGEFYALSPKKDEFNVEDPIWTLSAVESGAIASSRVDGYLAAIKKAGLSQDRDAFGRAEKEFLASASFGEGEPETLRASSEALFGIGKFKNMLSEKWRLEKFDMGVIGFTAFFALGTVLFSNFLAFWLAMALDRKLKSRNVLRSVFFLPNVLSMIVVALVWSFIFFHLLPRLTGIGTWMSDSAKAPWLLVMVSVWQSTGYYMIVYLAGLQNIPQDIVEAAMIDGAGPWTRLRRITLPLLMPAFTVCIFISTANALKCFDLVYAMVGPSGYATGTVPFVMDIFFDAFARKLAGLSTAKAMLLFLVILCVTGTQLLLTKRKEVQL